MTSSSSTSSLSSVGSDVSNYLKPKVALVGSGGLLGEATLQAFLSSEFANYFAKPIRVLTTNIQRVPPRDVSYVRIYWDEDDIDDQLSRALRGVRMVVNLLGYNRDAWDAVTRAVCRLKPALYIPPEFSFDHTLWDIRRIPAGSILDDKRRQTEAATAAGVLTVQVFCGMITENLLPVNAYADIEYTPTGRRIIAVLPDNGVDPSISFTSSWDVGRSIAYICSLPAIPTSKFHISGDIGSWSKFARHTKAQLQAVGVTAFEEHAINMNSPLESFLRIAAANGDLHYPATSRRRGAVLNENYLVDPTLTHRWIKLSTVVRGYDKHDNSNSTQASASSPEDTTKETKRKRGDTHSTSDESDAHAEANITSSSAVETGQKAGNSQNSDPESSRDRREQRQQQDDNASSKSMQEGLVSEAEAETVGAAAKVEAAAKDSATSKPKARITATPKPRSSILAATRVAAAAATRQAAADAKSATTTTTQQAPTAVLEKRVTRSMTKRQTASGPLQQLQPGGRSRQRQQITETPRLNDISRDAVDTALSEPNVKNDRSIAASDKRSRKRRKLR